jgi:hypothetical protein
LQHKASLSKPAGSVQTSFAQVNLFPIAVLAEEALPFELLPPPHADNTVTNPKTHCHVHCFIASPADDVTVVLALTPSRKLCLSPSCRQVGWIQYMTHLSLIRLGATVCTDECAIRHDCDGVIT